VDVDRTRDRCVAAFPSVASTASSAASRSHSDADFPSSAASTFTRLHSSASNRNVNDVVSAGSLIVVPVIPLVPRERGRLTTCAT
jgi:hypothetical protein